MSEFSGKDLHEVFKTLSINTGNVSNSTIDSWFDTDCKDMKELLNWMCCSITSENVLTSSEHDEYEQALKNQSLLSGKQYEGELKQLRLNYPGILDYDTNVFDCECMEDELMILLDDEKCQEGELKLNKNVSKILQRELAEKKEEEVALHIEREASKEKCMALSSQLDDVNQKLQEQICRYSKNLNEYDYAWEPVFLSNFPLNEYEQYYAGIESYISLVLKRESKTLSKWDTTVKSARKRLITINESDISEYTDILEILRVRISRSIYAYFCKQAEKEMLLAQIQYLKEADWMSISRDDGNNYFKSYKHIKKRHKHKNTSWIKES